MKAKKQEIDNKKRYERQSDIFCGEGLTVGIVGVGAVGRQIALQLSAMGVSKLVLIDYDKVEDVNLSAQGFREKDLGNYKVSAVAAAALELNDNTVIEQYKEIFHKEMVSECDYVFCCVDNMASRKQIMEDTQAKTPVFDSRMGALVCSIKSVTDDSSYNYYMDELFTDDEMVQETCTAKTTLFCANICAGMMITQLVTHKAGKPVKHDVCFDISNMTFIVRKKADVAMDDELVVDPVVDVTTFYRGPDEADEQERELAERDLADELAEIEAAQLAAQEELD